MIKLSKNVVDITKVIVLSFLLFHSFEKVFEIQIVMSHQMSI